MIRALLILIIGFAARKGGRICHVRADAETGGWADTVRVLSPPLRFPAPAAFLMKHYLVSVRMRHMEFAIRKGGTIRCRTARAHPKTPDVTHEISDLERRNSQVPNSSCRRYFNNTGIFFNKIIRLMTVPRHCAAKSVDEEGIEE
jgi:hypothetical protein